MTTGRLLRHATATPRQSPVTHIAPVLGLPVATNVKHGHGFDNYTYPHQARQSSDKVSPGEAKAGHGRARVYRGRGGGPGQDRGTGQGGQGGDFFCIVYIGSETFITTTYPYWGPQRTTGLILRACEIFHTLAMGSQNGYQ